MHEYSRDAIESLEPDTAESTCTGLSAKGLFCPAPQIVVKLLPFDREAVRGLWLRVVTVHEVVQVAYCSGH